jgi:hypothetical protein
MTILEYPKETVPISRMTNTQWITYKWINIQTTADSEPMYLCTGMRDISEAKDAEEQFKTWRGAVNCEKSRQKDGSS